MRIRALAFAAAVVLCASVVAADEPQNEAEKVLSSIHWVAGPGTGDMKDIAKIAVPDGYVFARAGEVGKLMELMQNPVSGQEIGFLSPKDLSWYMVFEFNPVGYVKDDERDSLDANAILGNIREATAAGNEERKRRGWGTFEVIGWEQTPHYDAASNNLTWAIRGRSNGSEVINYNTRLLGRSGVTEVTLVCSPAELAAITPAARRLVADYSFNPGQRYAEYRRGDKMAEYGLAALITGGTVAVAAKTGLLAKLIKLLTKVGVFLAAGAAALVKKLFGKKEEQRVL